MNKTTGIIAAIAGLDCAALARSRRPLTSTELPHSFHRRFHRQQRSTTALANPFADYFDLTKVNVVHSARAGRSSRTFQTEDVDRSWPT